jgi:hypothetical protein
MGVSEIDSNRAEKRGPGNPAWVKGGTSPNPGGRPKKLVEIERMLDDEHRTVENMSRTFDKLRSLATEDRVRTVITKKGDAIEIVTPPDPAFMRLYLERVMGPVRDLEPDLSDAPDEVINYLRSMRMS